MSDMSDRSDRLDGLDLWDIFRGAAEGEERGGAQDEGRGLGNDELDSEVVAVNCGMLGAFDAGRAVVHENAVGAAADAVERGSEDISVGLVGRGGDGDRDGEGVRRGGDGECALDANEVGGAGGTDLPDIGGAGVEGDVANDGECADGGAGTNRAVGIQG